MDIRLWTPLSFSLFISVRFVAVHALAHPTSRSTHCSLHSPPLSLPSSDSSLSCPGCCYSFQLNPDPVEIDCAGYGCHDPCAAKISNAQSSQTPYQNLAHPVATHPSHNDESSPLRLGCPQNPEQDVVVRHRQHVCVTLRNQCHCDHLITIKMPRPSPASRHCAAGNIANHPVGSVALLQHHLPPMVCGRSKFVAASVWPLPTPPQTTIFSPPNGPGSTWQPAAAPTATPDRCSPAARARRRLRCRRAPPSLSPPCCSRTTSDRLSDEAAGCRFITSPREEPPGVLAVNALLGRTAAVQGARRRCKPRPRRRARANALRSSSA